MAEPTRILILGGTGEAAALAMRLARHPDLAVITSLAGRTRAPPALPGEVRRGGFGGPAGLARFLRERAIELVVDATHPFAAAISDNAAEACRAAGVPRLMLARPAWRPQPNDRWIRVADPEAAAAALPELGRRVFLSTGRRDLEAFSALPGIWFLVRLIDEPDSPLPLDDYTLVLGRGPFPTEQEIALMQEHGIAVLVSKNSGGLATYGKIEAARRLGLPVVMIERPDLPESERVRSVDEAAAWVEARRTAAKHG
ncbi:MAG: cobalt-precorrin-6A reductase [Kiloniellaceae bacterium]